MVIVIKQSAEDLPRLLWRRMSCPRNQSKVCFVPGCKSGTKKTRSFNKEKGIKNPTIFRVPRDPDLLALWNAAINRVDRPLRGHDSVCELHFREDEIVKYFEIKLPGGVIDKIEREKYCLKKNAVPSIFPEDTLVKNSQKKRGPITKTLPEISVEVDEAERSSSGEDEEQNKTSAGGPSTVNDDTDVSLEQDPFDFYCLLKEAWNIVLPSDMWTVGVLKGCQVIFANWSDGETVEAKKKVLIDEELHVKVVFGSITLSLTSMKDVHSLEEVKTFLLVVHQLNVCEGYGKGSNARAQDCSGYTVPRNEIPGEVLDESSEQCHRCRNTKRNAVSLKSLKEADAALDKRDKLLENSKKSPKKFAVFQKQRIKRRLHQGGVTRKKPCPVPDPQRTGSAGDGTGSAESVLEGEEVDIEEWRPPPEWNSLTSPRRLLVSHPTNSLPIVGDETSGGREEGEEGRSRLPTLDALVKEVHRIPLPSDKWTVGVVKKKRLIFASWEDEEVLEAEKRLVIDENLNTKVVFGSKILSLSDVKEVHKIEDATRYLYIIDKLKECHGLGTGRRAASCPGYFLPGAVAGACVLRCAFCQGAREEMIRVRRMRGCCGEVRAEAQGKVWRNLKKLSDIYPELRRGPAASS